MTKAAAPKLGTAPETHRPIVVTTAHKGVFFGYVDNDHPADAPTIRLEQARMCVYWSAELKGVFGLASEGPSKGCKIGPAVPAITLRDVTSVIECSGDAAKKWEGGTWAR